MPSLAKPICLYKPRPGLPRYAFLLRLEVQGPPSLACPLGGTAIHWMAVCFRLAHGQALVAPKPATRPKSW